MLTRVTGLFLVFWLAGLAPAAWAQQAEVRGRVVEAGTGQPLPQVSVTLERGQAVVAGTVTDDDGRYHLRVPPGTYTLTARFVGYRITRVEGLAVAEDVVQDLALTADVVGLGEVEVEAGAVREASDVDVSVTRVGPRAVRQLAGGGEDVMRALQATPGVVAASDFSSRLIVRGGTPDQNLILLDEIEVFSPYQLNGIGSLLNPALIRRVDLHTGAFPAAFGDRLSSVLAVYTRDGRDDRALAGRVQSNMLDAGLTLEGRTGWGAGSWLVSGRRTYFDSFASTFARRVGFFNDVAFPDFADVQAKVAVRPARGHTVRLTALYSREVVDFVAEQDTYGQQEGGDGDLVGGDDTGRNAALGLAWVYAPTANFQAKVMANWYRNRGTSDLSGSVVPRDGLTIGPGDFNPDPEGNPPPPVFGGGDDPVAFDFEQSYRLEKTTVGGQAWRRHGRHLTEGGVALDMLRTGLDVGLGLNERGRFVFEAMQAVDPLLGALAGTVDAHERYHRFGVYVQDRYEAVPGRVFLQPSVRYDYYSLVGLGYVSPRMAASWALDEATTVRVAAGRYVQSPGFEKLLDPGNVFNLARYTHLDGLEAEKALHLGAGVSRRLGERWHVQVDGYWKRLTDLITQASRFVVRPVAEYLPHGSFGRQMGRLDPETYDVVMRTVFELTPEPINAGSGRSYGMELLVEHPEGEGGWSGWASYTLARADREQEVAGEVLHFPFAYDRRHALNLVMNRRLGRGFTAGLTWRYGSGFPYTRALRVEPVVGIAYDEELGEQRAVVLTDAATGYARLVPDYGEADNINASRLPAYHRLDARLAYATSWRGAGFEAYVDLINLYNRKNVLAYKYYVGVQEAPRQIPNIIRPAPKVLLYREPVYMFPFIPSLGFSVAF